MMNLISINNLILIYSLLRIININCYDNLNVEGPDFGSILYSCATKDVRSTFDCARSTLFNKFSGHSNHYDTHNNLNYYSWLMSIPSLSPNTVIYNNVPIEVDQSHKYVDNFLKEPKFVPMYYRINYNEYYDHFKEHIVTKLVDNPDKTRLTLLKDKLADLLNLPKINMRGKASFNTSFEQVFITRMIGNNDNSYNKYSKSLLLFIDYYFFRELKKRAYLFRFLNTFEFGYKLRFYVYCKVFSKLFRRKKNIMRVKNHLANLMDLSKYFDVIDDKIEPFIPTLANNNLGSIPLSIVSTQKGFNTLVENLLNNYNKDIDEVFKLLEEYAETMFKVKDIRKIPTLDSFYVFEVTPRSTGFSFYNMFPYDQRKQIIDYKDCFFVESHISKLDSKYYLFQIIIKFIIMIPLAMGLCTLSLVYIFKFVK